MAKEKIKLIVGETYKLSPDNAVVTLVRFGKVYASIKVDGKEIDVKIDRLSKIDIPTTVEQVDEFESKTDLGEVEVPEALKNANDILNRGYINKV